MSDDWQRTSDVTRVIECNERMPQDIYVCTKPKGHDGNHFAGPNYGSWQRTADAQPDVPVVETYAPDEVRALMIQAIKFACSEHEGKPDLYGLLHAAREYERKAQHPEQRRESPTSVGNCRDRTCPAGLALQTEIMRLRDENAALRIDLDPGMGNATEVGPVGDLATSHPIARNPEWRAAYELGLAYGRRSAESEMKAQYTAGQYDRVCSERNEAWRAYDEMRKRWLGSEGAKTSGGLTGQVSAETGIIANPNTTPARGPEEAGTTSDNACPTCGEWETCPGHGKDQLDRLLAENASLKAAAMPNASPDVATSPIEPCPENDGGAHVPDDVKDAHCANCGAWLPWTKAPEGPCPNPEPCPLHPRVMPATDNAGPAYVIETAEFHGPCPTCGIVMGDAAAHRVAALSSGADVDPLVRAAAELCEVADDWAKWIESKGGEPSSGTGAALLRAVRAYREESRR